MNTKNRIEALESMVGNLAERIIELEEEVRTLNEMLKKPRKKVDLEKDYFKVYISKSLLEED